jgi:dihydrofolate reductase
MGKVVFDISTSVDGFITGANPRPEAGLGDDGERLHNWFFNSADPYNREFPKWFERVGVNIFGRTGFNHSILYWGADGPSGPARIPTIIVSHTTPDNLPPGHVYRFVNGIEATFETAQKIAGDKDVYITGGNVAQQFLTRGLVDEISLHVVPVLFGSGTRLFDLAGSEAISLETLDVINTKEAIHTRFRVLK